MRFWELEEEAWSPVGFCWRKKTSSGMVTADLLMFLAVTSLPYLLLMFGYSFAWGG